MATTTTATTTRQRQRREGRRRRLAGNGGHRQGQRQLGVQLDVLMNAVNGSLGIAKVSAHRQLVVQRLSNGSVGIDSVSGNLEYNSMSS